MTSIAVHGGPTPHDALRDAVEWGRVVVATLARGVVATLLGLALWAAAPAVIGWQPTTVMTGSMEPRLTPGDVVVSRPVHADEVRMGKVLLADDPDQPGHLRMHRYVDEGPHGTLVTKGDANPQRDSTPLEPAAVHGVAFLRIPFVGSPIVWIREGEWPRVGLLALGLVAVLALSTVDGSLRRLVPSDETDDASGGDDDDAASGGSDGADDGLEARVDPATGLRSGVSPDPTRRDARRRERRAHRLRRLGGAAAVLVLTSGAGLLLPGQAEATPWTKTTATSTSFAAMTVPVAPTLTCTQTSAGTVTIAWTYSGDAPSSFDLVNGSTSIANAPGTARSLTYSGSGWLNLGTTSTLHLRTNLAGSWTGTSTAAIKVRVTVLLGSTATCAP